MLAVRHWTRDRALAPLSPADLDELDDADVLVLDDVEVADVPRLSWCGTAPCIVISLGGDGRAVGGSDVIVAEADLSRVLECIEANPQAARTLIDVLRVVEVVSVAQGLTVESLAYSMLLGGEEFRRWLAANPRPAPKVFDRPPVILNRDGDRLLITLDRPENRNAHSAPMRDALCEALDLAAADPSISDVVLDANGPAFSSGGDLSEFGTATDLVRAHQIRTLRSVGGRLASLPARTTVHVKGPCVGAGVEIPALADRFVAEPETTFRLPEVAMGLIPGAGGTVSLTRRIGRQRTAGLALLGRELGTEQALAWGLIDSIG